MEAVYLHFIYHVILSNLQSPSILPQGGRGTRGTRGLLLLAIQFSLSRLNYAGWDGVFYPLNLESDEDGECE